MRSSGNIGKTNCKSLRTELVSVLWLLGLRELECRRRYSGPTCLMLARCRRHRARSCSWLPTGMVQRCDPTSSQTGCNAFERTSPISSTPQVRPDTPIPDRKHPIRLIPETAWLDPLGLTPPLEARARLTDFRTSPGCWSIWFGIGPERTGRQPNSPRVPVAAINPISTAKSRLRKGLQACGGGIL